ncbi:hypothetical protein [Mesoflavibacter zeaxanthinifaciens]|uniref:hypothetical protein n=1 Tax=Mesoflavibacter zeaxanthinifaciens TaxID=393060 RepID=UPI00041CA06A|nr:hypothetical protein [Mesoflavibacter zeaxanthinifaciens]
MTTKTKKTGLIVILSIIVLIVGYFITKTSILNKVENYLSNLPEHIELQYKSIDLDLLNGDFNIQEALLTIKGKTTEKINTQLEFKTLSIEDFSYWNYWKNNTIDVENINVKSPKITHFYNKQVSSEDFNTQIKSQVKSPIYIETFSVENANVEIFDFNTEDVLFKSEQLNLSTSNIVFNANTSNAKIPFKFESFNFSVNQTFYVLNDFENLTVNKIEVHKNNATFTDLNIKTKYEKQELSKHLKVERDYYDLNVKEIVVNDFATNFKNDSIFSFTTENVVIKQPNFNIYRDKLVADDLSVKPMYSKQLRDLNFDLKVKNVQIKNAFITYEEKVKHDKPAGQIKFTNLNANISHLGNAFTDLGTTKIDVTSTFMDNSNLKVSWDFDVNNQLDQFVFKADIGVLNASQLNQFMEPNLNIRLDGQLQKTYFTINGNSDVSNIDLKTKYENFDVIVLKENGEEKNKFLSGLINLFVSNNSNDQSDNFRKATAKNIQRVKHKSVFNFIWVNIRAGLKEAML